MKVFVTGADGLLGSTLVPYLRDCGHDVATYLRYKADGSVSDLSDEYETDQSLEKAVPEVIINLASLTNVDECEKSPYRAYLSNVRIIENLVSWVKNKNPSCHLIQISTDHVYDGFGPHLENDVTFTNFYAFSKYAGELVASRVQSTVLRTNFFGPSACKTRKSLSDWLFDSLHKKASITVFEDVKFNPLSISTLVKMIELSMRNQHTGVFNLGSKGNMSKADFALEFASAIGLSAEYVKRDIIETARLYARRPRNMHMDSSKFELTFGIKLPSLKQEIDSMRDAYEK